MRRNTGGRYCICSNRMVGRPKTKGQHMKITESANDQHVKRVWDPPELGRVLPIPERKEAIAQDYR